jgi:glucosamine--fructose-6-phosphate aminotransferase (isomerizing)
VPLGAGLERAVPATKTVTAQMAVFAVIAEALGAAPWDAEVWRRLPDGVGRVLADDEPAQVAAAAIGSAAGLIAVGRGLLFGAALEAALKLKETTGLHAEGYSAADLRHGPLAVIDAGFPVLALSARGPAAADMADLTRRLAAERGARVLRVADDAAADLALPQDLPEAPSAITAVVRAQQLALALALRRDLDPDTPPGSRRSRRRLTLRPRARRGRQVLVVRCVGT